jgi:hypothetical protein
MISPSEGERVGGGQSAESYVNVTHIASVITSYVRSQILSLVSCAADTHRSILKCSNVAGARRLFVIIISGVRLSPLGTAATVGLLYPPQVIDDGDCGAVGGIKIVRGNRSTRRKPAPVPLYPPQIPYDLPRARTRAAVVGSQRLTA